jgi:hypothetical protein
MNQSQCLFRSLARLLVGLAVAALLATVQYAAAGPAPALPRMAGLGAEVRLRPTYRTNFDNIEEQDDGALWMRARLNVGISPTPWLKFTFQGQDSRLYWRAAWRSPSENPFDVRQVYVSVGRSDRSQLHVGRQELRYGGDRLIGRRNWSNFDPAWDAARLVLRRGEDQVDIFSMSFVGIDPNGFDNPFEDNRSTASTEELARWSKVHIWSLTCYIAHSHWSAALPISDRTLDPIRRDSVSRARQLPGWITTLS